MSLPALRVEPVRVWVRIPPATDRPCDADGCGWEAVGHVMWLTPGWRRVETASACGRHLAVARAAGRCLIFPWGMLPPPDVVLPAVNDEIRRRQQAQRPTVFYPMSFGTGGTATFGGIQFNMTFTG